MDDGMHEQIEAAVRTLSKGRDAIIKAHIIEAARPESTHIDNSDENERAFGFSGALQPPYDPRTLATLLENSNALRQCIDAYVTNIDAFGHRFEPTIDLESADADARVRSYLLARSYRANEDVVLDPAQQVAEPTEEEVEAAKRELAERMRDERA